MSAGPITHSNKRPVSSSSYSDPHFVQLEMPPRKIYRRGSKGTALKRKSRVPRSMGYGMATIHRFVRSTGLPQAGIIGSNILRLQQPASNGGGGGFNGIAYDLQFAFSLESTYIYFNGTLTYTLTNSGYGDFSNLFDFYRIDKVEISWIFTKNSAEAGTTTVQSPNFVVAKDYNDTNGVLYNTLLEYQSAKTWSAVNDTRTHKTIIRPKVQQVIYNGLISAYAEPANAMWMNTATDGVNQGSKCIHYGVKLAYNAIDLSSSATPQVVGYLSPVFKYFISCKNAK